MQHKVSIRRVYVSRGGYERGTRQYWGMGAPLYRLECTCDKKDCPLWLGETTRADNREHAKEQAKKRFDTGHVVTFFR